MRTYSSDLVCVCQYGSGEEGGGCLHVPSMMMVVLQASSIRVCVVQSGSLAIAAPRGFVSQGQSKPVPGMWRASPAGLCSPCRRPMPQPRGPSRPSWPLCDKAPGSCARPKNAALARKPRRSHAHRARTLEARATPALPRSYPNIAITYTRGPVQARNTMGGRET